MSAEFVRDDHALNHPSASVRLRRKERYQNLENEVEAEVRDHRGDQAPAPVQPAEDETRDAVSHEFNRPKTTEKPRA
jgi:hypothetical protein